MLRNVFNKRTQILAIEAHYLSFSYENMYLN